MREQKIQSQNNGNAFHRDLEANEKKTCAAVEPPLPPTTMECWDLEATKQHAVEQKEREGWCAKLSRAATTQGIRKQDFLFSVCYSLSSSIATQLLCFSTSFLSSK